MCVDRPIFLFLERLNVTLAFHNETQRNGLHTSSGKSATNFVPQERGDLVPDNTIKNATRLLRVNQVPVDLPRMIKRGLHCLGSDFVEGYAMNGNTAATLLLRLCLSKFLV